MQIPATFYELLWQLTSSLVFLGTADVALNEILWRFFPTTSSRVRQFVSLILPFVLSIAAYLIAVVLNYQQLGIDRLYSVVVLAMQVALGGQLMFVLGKPAVAATRPADMRTADAVQGAVESLGPNATATAISDNKITTASTATFTADVNTKGDDHE